ncbi:6,7-dimethyl-8-ribityllumazine synthase [Candidatus Zixiibacteriota bacterium]
MSNRVIEGSHDGSGLRIGIVAARFNGEIVQALLDGALEVLTESGVTASDVTVIWVPGALELPLAAALLADSGSVDGIIGLGCVIQGETAHFDHVCRESIEGLSSVSFETGVPVMVGVLTVGTVEQAQVRAGLKPGSGGAKGEEDLHRGKEAARACIEMITLLSAMEDIG